MHVMHHAGISQLHIQMNMDTNVHPLIVNHNQERALHAAGMVFGKSSHPCMWRPCPCSAPPGPTLTSDMGAPLFSLSSLMRAMFAFAGDADDAKAVQCSAEPVRGSHADKPPAALNAPSMYTEG